MENEKKNLHLNEVKELLGFPMVVEAMVKESSEGKPSFTDMLAENDQNKEENNE